MIPHASRSILLFTALTAAAVVSRFLWIAPNFTAVAAASLFAGFMFRNRRVAAGVPLLALLVSDAVIGFYPWPQMLAVYGSLVAPVFLGRLLQGRAGAPRIIASSLAGSIVFYVATNFAVWLSGPYGYDGAGLVKCYVAAIPFFKYTLTGDLVFSAVFFGLHASVQSSVRLPRAVPWRPGRATPAC